MHTKYLYWATLTLTCSYALLRGRGDARVAAAVCAIASLVTHFIIAPKLGGFYSFETGVLLVDTATFAAFVIVALTSSRFWPLWIAGLQMTTLLAHAMRLMSSDLLPIAYAAAGRFWSYPILLILVAGTWRHQSRTRAEAGRAFAT